MIKNKIKNFFDKIKSLFTYIWTNKKKKRIWVSAIVIIVALLMSMGGGASADTYELKIVEKGEFVQEVSVTGKVTPAQKVDMGFETSGRLASVEVKVGDRVKKGKSLARLSNADYQASVVKSQASYQSEQARLAELQRGARPQEIAIAQSDVQLAQQNVDQAILAVIEETKDSYALSEDAVKNQADQVFNSPQSVNPELRFFVDQNPRLQDSVESQRLRLTEQFPVWQKLVTTLTPATIDDSKIAEAKKYVTATQTFLNDLNVAMTSMGENLNNDPSMATYRTGIIAARTSVNSAVQALNTAVNTLKNNQSSLVRAKEQLTLKQSGSTAEEIAAQRAQAQSAAAGISSASASLSKTIIVAPFDGIVTRVEYKTGESVSAATPVITLMSDAAFEIETYVSENDVPKLRVGQNAKVTLDALGDAVIFDAAVSLVDLSETIKDGVVTYRTRLQFISQDERIKSGLTANVIVETDRRMDVVKVPQSAIVLEKGKKHVKVAPAGSVEWSKEVDGKATLVPVTTGGIDRNGDIEIVSGISAQDKIIVRVPKAVTK